MEGGPREIITNFRFANMNNVTWEVVAYDPWFDLGRSVPVLASLYSIISSPE